MSTPKQRLLLMLPLLAIAGGLAVFGDKTPAGSAPAVVAAVATPPAGAPEVVPEAASEPAAAPAPVPDANDVAITGQTSGASILRMKARLNLAEIENGPQANLFASSTPAPAAPAAAPDAAQAPQAPPAPVAPFAWIGRMREGQSWVAFLDDHGKVHLGRQGQVIEGFRIVAIRDEEIELMQVADKVRVVVPFGGEKHENRERDEG